MDTEDWVVRRVPARARPFFVIAAGVVLQLTFGIVYTFGNLLPYLVSYLRWKVNPEQTTGSMIWLQSFMAGIPCAMLLGGFLEGRIGARAGATLGACMYTGFMAASCWTLQHSYWLFFISFGLCSSFGQGIAYNCILITAQRWLPDRVGLASGLITGGFGCGAFLMSPLQTKFVNPKNYAVDPDGYFTQVDLLERVPQVFLLMAAVFAILQIICLFFLASPSQLDDDLSLIDQEAVESDPNTLTTREVLSSSTFWILFATLGLNAVWGQVASGFFKAYGITFIKDDFFLASVSSFAAATNCVSRILWGLLMDATSYQTSMAIACVTGSSLMWTLGGVRYTGSAELFFIWICLMYSIIGATYSLIPSAVHKCFGGKNFGIAYGVAQLSLSFSGFTAGFCSMMLLPRLGFEIFFLMFGFATMFSFTLTVFIQKSEYGRAIRSTNNLTSFDNPNHESLVTG